MPAPRTILVAGGTGHLGERLVCRLLQRGDTVRVLTREPDGPVARGLARRGADIRSGDFYRRWTLWEALEGCDVLINAAHARHAEACIQACRITGVTRFIMVSSTWRFSRHRDRTVDEVINGESVVAVSTLDWTIVRPNMIFGGARDNNMSHLVRRIRERRYFGIIPVFGTGGQLVQPVYVEDVVSAIVAALERPESIGLAFNIAGPDPIPYNRFLREIAKAAGVAEPRIITLPIFMAELLVRFMPWALRAAGLTPNQVRRQAEDRHVNIQPAWEVLGFRPLPFSKAIRLKIEGQAEVEVLYPLPAEAVPAAP